MTPDRLSLIERRHREAGGGDADKAWLIEECKQLRDALAGCDIRAQLDEALNSGRGEYKP